MEDARALGASSESVFPIQQGAAAEQDSRPDEAPMEKKKTLKKQG